MTGRKMWCENDSNCLKFESLDLMVWGPKERNDRFHLKTLNFFFFLFTVASFFSSVLAFLHCLFCNLLLLFSV